MVKTNIALALAMVMGLMLLAAPGADAKQGRGGHDDPPECQVEDGGVLVCK